MSIEHLLPDQEQRRAVARAVFDCLPHIEQYEQGEEIDWETHDIMQGWNSCREIMALRIIELFQTEQDVQIQKRE